jgi:hypothetical protein
MQPQQFDFAIPNFPMPISVLFGIDESKDPKNIPTEDREVYLSKFHPPNKCTKLLQTHFRFHPFLIIN